MFPSPDSGLRIGPRLSIVSALGIPLLLVIVFNPDFRLSLPRFFQGQSDWNSTVDTMFSNGVLTALIGGSIAVLIASSFLQAITTVGIIVRGVILLAGISLMINLASIQRIDGYIETHFLGKSPTASVKACDSSLQIEDVGDSIRATLKGSPGAQDAPSRNAKCGAS